MKQKSIVAAVREGRYDPITWAEVHSGPVAFQVMTDALKLDGVRVPVTARTAQHCADTLGASLPTPLIEDLIYQAADIRIRAFTIDSGPSLQPAIGWSQAVENSRRIDEALAAEGALPSQLVATVGKAWCLGNILYSKLGRALNYGWHTKGATAHAVSDDLMVIQSIGTRHTADHWDYSQTCRLVRRSCRVAGAQASLFDVLTDLELCRWLTHEGPLRILRQPGIEVLA